MLAFAMAAADVQQTILSSFYTPNRNPGESDVACTGTESDGATSTRNSLPDIISTSPKPDPDAGDEASSELLDASLRCANWLQSLATSYMALAVVPELAELLSWPAESLADAALAFVFSAHRFRGRIRPILASQSTCTLYAHTLCPHNTAHFLAHKIELHARS